MGIKICFFTVIAVTIVTSSSILLCSALNIQVIPLYQSIEFYMLFCRTYFDLFICCEVIARNAIKNWYRVVCKCHVYWFFYLIFILRIWTKSCKFIEFISYETNLYTWWCEPHWYIDIETCKQIDIILKSKKIDLIEEYDIIITLNWDTNTIEIWILTQWLVSHEWEV